MHFLDTFSQPHITGSAKAHVQKIERSLFFSERAFKPEGAAAREA